MATAKKKRKSQKDSDVKETESTTVESTQESKPQETEEVRSYMQLPIDPNVINIPMSRDELAGVINLLGLTVKTIETLALVAAEQGDNTKFLTLSARYQMLMQFGLKLQQVHQIGEPQSQTLH